MLPKKPSENVLEIHKNLSTIYNRSQNKDYKNIIVDPGVLGPVAVTCCTVLVFALCICFWSIKNPGTPEEYYRSTYGIDPPSPEANYKTPAGIETLENGLATDLEMRGGGGAGSHDNPCYQGDNMDALSHFTSSTEICETNQTDYIAQHEENTRQAAIERDKAALRADNVKLVFQHDPQNNFASLTGSMDETDAEVAGIYKTFTTPGNPLLVRMDSLATPPPQPIENKPHVIELVETPDCTSIDTNIPEDELFGRYARSQF